MRCNKVWACILTRVSIERATVKLASSLVDISALHIVEDWRIDWLCFIAWSRWHSNQVCNQSIQLKIRQAIDHICLGSSATRWQAEWIANPAFLHSYIFWFDARVWQACIAIVDLKFRQHILLQTTWYFVRSNNVRLDSTGLFQNVYPVLIFRFVSTVANQSSSAECIRRINSFDFLCARTYSSLRIQKYLYCYLRLQAVERRWNLP